jgi:hypothetical protein
MKKLIIIVCGILFATSASASLWSYYTSRGEQLPPISERAIIAETCGISDYSGTYDQNIALEKCLVGEQQLGISLPNVAALFETSLQNSVSADATTMTLVSATLKNGNTLSGLYGFIIDEGSANEEFVICTASSTALSACLRGIDPVDGKTEVSALKYSHRRGASIKITDYPILGIMRRVLNGQEGLPNFLYYDASTTLPTLDGQLATKYYVDTVGAGGFTSANVSTTRGLSVDGSSPERVGINVSSTQGMAFDSSGALYNTWLPGSDNSTDIGSSTLQFKDLYLGGIIYGGNLGTYFGTSADGSATLSASTTLTSDKHYTNLTINSGVVLNTGGYRLFVSGTLTNNGTIRRNGNTGGTGGNGTATGGVGATGGTAGTGGTALASGSLFGSLVGSAGGAGGVGNNTCAVGVVGTTSYSFISATSSAGGTAGNSSHYSGCAGGTFATNILEYSYLTGYNYYLSVGIVNETFVSYVYGTVSTSTLSNFSSSGGGGGAVGMAGGSGEAGGGGGGGAGSGGGIIYISAYNLINNGTIQATGGNGGTGGNGATVDTYYGGGGGGGAGGHGGLLVLIYKNLTEGTLTVTGGTGGTGGAGSGGTSAAGSTGGTGKTGSIIKIKL